MRARAILEDAGGQAITGYRAPSFSIGGRKKQLSEALPEEMEPDTRDYVALGVSMMSIFTTLSFAYIQSVNWPGL